MQRCGALNCGVRVIVVAKQGRRECVLNGVGANAEFSSVCVPWAWWWVGFEFHGVCACCEGRACQDWGS